MKHLLSKKTFQPTRKWSWDVHWCVRLAPALAILDVDLDLPEVCKEYPLMRTMGAGISKPYMTG